MQISVMGSLIAAGLFASGCVIALFIIGRHVPQLGILKGMAKPRQEIEASRMPLWVRMIVLPTLSISLPILLPYLVLTFEPHSLTWLMEIFGPDMVIVPILVFAGGAIGYHWRERLSYYREEE